MQNPRNNSYQLPPELQSNSERLSPTLPLPPPRSMEDLEQLVRAIAFTPTGDKELIFRSVEVIAEDKNLLELAHSGLRSMPVGDIGMRMTLLSLVGQIRDDRSLEVLHDLVWTATSNLWGELGSSDNSGCIFVHSGVIQARAAEMFGWIATTRKDEELLRIVSDHPERTARLAAADTYLYHHNDSADHVRIARDHARKGDQTFVGVPRFVRTENSDQFDDLLTSIGEISENAQLPHRVRNMNGRRDV